jgi:hypothetical protein
MGSVKTTLEIPDDLFREMKAAAAESGQQRDKKDPSAHPEGIRAD